MSWSDRSRVYEEVEKILYSYSYVVDRVNYLTDVYEQLQIEISQDSCITAVSYSDIKSQSTSISDIVPKRAIQRMMRLSKAEKKLKNFELQKIAIEEFVNELENDRGRDIIKRRYFYRELGKDIGKEQGVTKNMIAKIKRREMYRLIDVFLEKGDYFGFW